MNVDDCDSLDGDTFDTCFPRCTHTLTFMDCGNEDANDELWQKGHDAANSGWSQVLFIMFLSIVMKLVLQT